MRILVLSNNPYSDYIRSIANALKEHELFFTQISLAERLRRKIKRLKRRGRLISPESIVTLFHDYVKVLDINPITKILKIKSASDPKIINYIKKNQIELGFYAGLGILRKPLLDTLKIINNHMGLLPEFKGMNVLEWSLFYNKPLYITHHFIDSGIDTGDIIASYPIPIKKNDTVEILRQKSLIVSHQNIKNTLQQLDKAVKQEKTGKQYFAMHKELLTELNKTLSE